jgi:hypothetical protein
MQVRRPVWVGKMEASAGGWVLQGEGRSQGVYDFCVVAHNGKCANRCVPSLLVGISEQPLWLPFVWLATHSVPQAFYCYCCPNPAVAIWRATLAT